MVDVEIGEHEGTTVCRPVGELDAFTIATFREQLAGLAGAGDVIIDLSSVPFMDSAGLGALIGGIRKVRDGGGEIIIVYERSAVLRLLHTTRFDRMVEVVPTLADASGALTAPD